MKGRLAAFVRFRHYVDRRAYRYPRQRRLDALRLRDLRERDPHEVVTFRAQRLDMPASVWAVIFGLARASDSSPKTIIEAIMLIGLEQTADSLRATGSAPSILAPTAEPMSSVSEPVGIAV